MQHQLALLMAEFEKSVAEHGMGARQTTKAVQRLHAFVSTCLGW